MKDQKKPRRTYRELYTYPEGINTVRVWEPEEEWPPLRREFYVLADTETLGSVPTEDAAGLAEEFGGCFVTDES